MSGKGETAPSLLVIDDHPVFRAGLVSVLAQIDPELRVREASSLAEAWDTIRSDPPRCATLDVQLGDGNGLTLLRKARACGVATRFVIISLFDDALLRDQAIALGASGFVTKDQDTGAVADVVQRVLAEPLPPLTELPLEPPPLAQPSPPVLEGLSRLSRAERLVLRHLSMNLTSAEIAAELGLSRRTVQNHRAHICEKLGLRGNNKLLEVALSLRDVLHSHEED